ncbi:MULTISPECIES: hypothetical protein [Streptomyces]|uniref:hypothetical protein n=1 Tax=Streptomyces TaxID=1883 RepID=UPI002E2A7BF5|nr:MULTISPECIES: hypothetical protein [Streptomyces]
MGDVHIRVSKLDQVSEVLLSARLSSARVSRSARISALHVDGDAKVDSEARIPCPERQHPEQQEGSPPDHSETLSRCTRSAKGAAPQQQRAYGRVALDGARSLR